jgi:hypothetical protein
MPTDPLPRPADLADELVQAASRMWNFIEVAGDVRTDADETGLMAKVRCLELSMGLVEFTRADRARHEHLTLEREVMALEEREHALRFRERELAQKLRALEPPAPPAAPGKGRKARKPVEKKDP